MKEYNKLIIFDLDGVLLDSRDLHYYSLNKALFDIDQKYVISREEHLSTFDGLSTSAKLKILTETRGLPPKDHTAVWKKKQQYTLEEFDKLKPDKKIIKLFKILKENGYMIACASNSIRETVKLALLNLGIIKYCDYYQSNEDVLKHKPYPEMYWNCMKACGAIPKTTFIIEDSHIGRQGAIDSGANLIPVENRHDVTEEYIMSALDTHTERASVPWRDKSLNVLVPMAGEGSRFSGAGYTFPKPLIEVHGKPMIKVVVDNLNIEANYIFLVRKEHYEKYNLKYLLEMIAPKCKIVIVDKLTEGAACTALLAEALIDNDNPLLISNSDQFMEWNSNECMYAFKNDNIDGGILSFKATHPKWSFAKLGEDGFVSEVAEKKPISDNATVGVYYWKHGSDFCKYAKQMIQKNIRTNNEFYICPVYNEAIQDGKKIRIKEIQKMWGLGTPEDLNYFLQNYKGKF